MVTLSLTRFFAPVLDRFLTGSEAEVKQNRISIQDNHALRTFKVIMENLTNGDAGTYLCGVEKAQQYDIWHPVEVKVTAGISSFYHNSCYTE